MKKPSVFLGIILLGILSACKMENNKNPNDLTNKESEKVLNFKPIIADYKSSLYKISLGQNYKLSDKIIDWQSDLEADNDGKIDSTGKDSFMYFGEPLINYNNGNWLPALHIETDKNLITYFKCSILFDLENKPKSTEEFLNLLSKNIHKLKTKSVVDIIKQNGIYEVNSSNYKEIYRLTKSTKDRYDKFEYFIEIKNVR